MSNQAVQFCAVGDIALGDHPLCTGFGTHSRCRKDKPGFAFEHVASTFSRADVVFGNLECTLSESGLRSKDYHSIQMRGHPAYLAGLKQAGFHMLNLANNHSLQHGPAAFQETVEMLRGAEIGTCGVNNGDYRNSGITVINQNGLRIAFVGYSMRPRQYFTNEPLYAEGTPTTIVDDVRRARAQADAVVVSLHWGDEFIDRPSPEEIGIAHDIMDAGADLIIGHHPHVLRGVERYGRGYIVYSLGNFVCDMLWDSSLRETAIVQCRLTANGVADFSLVPVRINDDYQPVVLEGQAATALLDRIQKLSDHLQSISKTPVARESMEQYMVAADDAHRKARSKSHRYFLTQAYRFPPRLAIQQVTTYIKNRFAERGLIKQSTPASGC